MGAPQEHSKVRQIELQTPETGGVKPWHILVGLALLVAVFVVSHYPWPTFIGLGIGVAVWALTSNYFRLEWEAKERAALATSYACICGPQIISAIWPDESPAELEARANTFREKLRDSGNPYWQIIPIKIRYYQPVLSLPGHLSTAWDEYQYAAISAQHEENMRWLSSGCPEGLKVAFASQVMKANQNQNQAV